MREGLATGTAAAANEHSHSSAQKDLSVSSADRPHNSNKSLATLARRRSAVSAFLLTSENQPLLKAGSAEAAARRLSRKTLL
jgi:hypothetical protein